MNAAPVPGSAEHTRLMTASKVAAVLGVSPFQSPYSLWHEMKGLLARPEANTVQRRGHYLEPAILAWFRDHHGLEAGEFWHEQVWHEHEGWAGCTVDAEYTALDGLEIVEAKSTNSLDEWGVAGSGDIPAYYLAQVLFQLAITGAKRCRIPILGPRLVFTEFVVEADHEMQAATLAACRRFYDSLSLDEPPALDDHVATFEAVRRMQGGIEAKKVHELGYDDALRLTTAVAELDRAKAEDRLRRSEVLSAMGTAQYAEHNGVRVARRQNHASGTPTFVVVGKPHQLDQQEPKEIAS